MSDQIETRAFETETSQLLQLMIHSLYSNKEIFLRELISNASDALDKLRFESVKNSDLLEGGGDLVIQVEVDPENNRVVVRDNGIGMPQEFDLSKADSLGLKLVAILAQDQLRGSVEMKCQNGTMFIISFSEENNE